jgi:hypothetical protein
LIDIHVDYISLRNARGKITDLSAMVNINKKEFVIIIVQSAVTVSQMDEQVTLF